MKEVEEEFTPLALMTNINGKDHEIIIDTGVSSNYMSTKSAKQVGLEGNIRPLENKERIEVANGKTQKITSFISYKFKGRNFTDNRL